VASTALLSDDIANDDNQIVNPHADKGFALSNIIDSIVSKALKTDIKRRDFFKVSVGVTALSTVGCAPLEPYQVKLPSEAGLKTDGSKFSFNEIPSGVDGDIHVPDGYDADVLISWGQALHKNMPDFDPYNQTLEGQLKRFGYNNDFLGYLPLPAGSDNPNHGLLCVNHEYVYEPMAFPKPLGKDNHYSEEQVNIAQAACGNSIVEIIRDKKTKKWRFIQDSPYNRRINMYDTPIGITGAAAGHKRMQTSQDPTGREIIGTFQNCAGGITPWGTYLTCEENINYAFGDYNKADPNHPEIKKSKRFGLGAFGDWYLHNKRFDLTVEPNEINRFGWVVEIDPYDPTSKPRKHSALGRFKHENCRVTIDKKTNKAVAYMGDDQYFEYLYKFISDDVYIKGNKRHNMTLLEKGTLYVARFNKDMSLDWIPLIHGQNGLTAKNGFDSQADVMIDARYAGDTVGATPLDRPEGVAIDPKNGDIYVSLTMNEKRTTPNVANPRIQNEYGQIVHLKANHQHSSLKHAWDILLLAGPAEHGGTVQAAGSTEDGTLACPDNLAFDHHGRLWVATDQGTNWGKKTGKSDGLYAVEHEGANKGKSKLFFRSPVGAETTGICFAPDDKTMFICVQHPGTDGCRNYKGFEHKSTFLDPATRWPNAEDSKMPPLPSVVQITRKGEVI
jgi:secreted PhoX family phosphatase